MNGALEGPLEYCWVNNENKFFTNKIVSQFITELHHKFITNKNAWEG